MSEQVESCINIEQDELFVLALNGDASALNEIFGSCMPRLLRVAHYSLRDLHDSEDALQDGLLSAFRHMDQFKGNSKFSTWLFSIIRNAARIKLRNRQSRLMLSIDDPPFEESTELFESEALTDPRPNPEREYIQRERSRILSRTLEDLPPAYREIILLCDIEGLSGKEAAERLGLTVSALKAKHHRARRAICAALNESPARSGV